MLLSYHITFVGLVWASNPNPTFDTFLTLKPCRRSEITNKPYICNLHAKGFQMMCFSCSETSWNSEILLVRQLGVRFWCSQKNNRNVKYPKSRSTRSYLSNKKIIFKIQSIFKKLQLKNYEIIPPKRPLSLSLLFQILR